jgi:hypothetical protein
MCPSFLEGVLPLSDQQITVCYYKVQRWVALEFPLYNVELKSDLISGSVVIGVRPSLPVKGVLFLLGNNLSGRGKVMPYPVVFKEPKVEEPDGLSEKYPRGFLACAVTNDMSKICQV